MNNDVLSLMSHVGDLGVTVDVDINLNRNLHISQIIHNIRHTSVLS